MGRLGSIQVAAGSLIAIAAFVVPSLAVAEQRFVAPGGEGADCTKPDPCSLPVAMQGAKSNDEVIVAGGSYVLPEHAFTEPSAENVFIHGDFSSAPPKIVGAVSGGLIYLNASGRIAHLDVTNEHQESNAVECREGGMIERVTGTAIGQYTVGINLKQNCSVRDSVARTSGPESFALYSSAAGGTGVATNVTAIATGPKSFAVVTDDPDHSLVLRNSIASGEAGDLRPYGPGTITVTRSNFDQVPAEGEAFLIDAGGNQSAPPLFVDAGAADFREAAGSPTIDAGEAGGLGELDLAGNARLLGPAPDIGAYEFSPPAAGQILSLSVAPRKFRAFGAGEPTGGGILKSKPPVRTRVDYSLSAPSTVTFKVSRVLKGRRVGKKCRRQTKGSRSKKRCARLKPVQGSFSVAGVAAANSFTMSGRLANRTLALGRYRLTGSAGGVSKSAPFRIAGVLAPSPK